MQDQKSLFSGGLKVWSEDKTFCSTEFKLHLRVKKQNNNKKKERKKNLNFGSEYNSGLLKVENLIYSCDVLQERMDVLKYLLWKHL